MASAEDGGTDALNPTASASDDSGGPPPAAPPDPASIVSYIAALAAPAFEADLDDVKNALDASDALDVARRFASEPGSSALFLRKEGRESSTSTTGARPSQTASNGPGSGSPLPALPSSFAFVLSATPAFPPTLLATMVVVKRAPLSSLVPLPAQLQSITLGEGVNPYEALYGVVTGAVGPVFEAWSEAGGNKGETDVSKDRGGWFLSVSLRCLSTTDKSNILNLAFNFVTGIPTAKRKIAELSLSLLSLQQNVSIPDPHLVIHPSIRNAIATARAAGRKASPDDLESLVSDPAYLNRLQADVNSWVKEIQKVTRMDRDPSQGSATQEISFWISMERALSNIEVMLRSDEVVLTLDVLKNAKRFHATVGFLSDTGLKEAVDRVGKISNNIMKEFPMSDLLSATDVPKLQEAVESIFSHINKKMRVAPYPTKRALALVEAISRDFNEVLLRILSSRRLLYLPYSDFDAATIGCDDLFRTWDDQSKEFISLARDLNRKRGEKFLPMKIAPAHAKLQERIVYLRQFRLQHEELLKTVVSVMKGDGKGKDAGLANDEAIEDINGAYELVRSVDVLDVSVEGTEAWVNAENLYNERISRVENTIIVSLRDRLATCKNANEMFRVFGKFNALFVRPKIRGAIQEYQAQLIENVKEDIRWG